MVTKLPKMIVSVKREYKMWSLIMVKSHQKPIHQFKLKQYSHSNANACKIWGKKEQFPTKVHVEFCILEEIQKPLLSSALYIRSVCKMVNFHLVESGARDMKKKTRRITKRITFLMRFKLKFTLPAEYLLTFYTH